MSIPIINISSIFVLLMRVKFTIRKQVTSRLFDETIYLGQSGRKTLSSCRDSNPGTLVFKAETLTNTQRRSSIFHGETTSLVTLSFIVAVALNDKWQN